MEKEKEQPAVKKPPYKPYQCPIHIADAMEKIAEERRKSTGQLVQWTDIMRELLDGWNDGNLIFETPKKK